MWICRRGCVSVLAHWTLRINECLLWIYDPIKSERLGDWAGNFWLISRILLVSKFGLSVRLSIACGCCYLALIAKWLWQVSCRAHELSPHFPTLTPRYPMIPCHPSASADNKIKVKEQPLKSDCDCDCDVGALILALIWLSEMWVHLDPLGSLYMQFIMQTVSPNFSGIISTLI